MQACLGPDFDINEFPCSFNMSRIQKLRLIRLRAVEHILNVELKNENNCKSDIIRKKNLLSFIYFRLNKLEEAVQLSDDLVKLTQRRNVATLANRCFILWRNGDELEVRECGKSLRSLKNEEDFHVLLTEAKAEQAYYYLKLGGPDNLRQAEMLFSQVVNEVPTNYLWKYGLGLVCGRATHGNILSCSSKPVDLDALEKKSIQYFFEVADNGESWLKSMAYAELVNLRHQAIFQELPEDNALFRGLSVVDLVDKALENNEGKLHSVLTQCGKALRWINTNSSIRLLEESVVIKPYSKSYHYLAKSYKRKAQLQLKINKGYLSPGDTETDAVEQFARGRGGQGRTSYCRSSRWSPSANTTSRGYKGSGQPHSAPQHYQNSYFNYGQCEQTFPRDRQQQSGYHDSEGMHQFPRGRTNCTRSFSSPMTAYEPNRRFHRTGSNSRRSGRADSFVGRSLSERGIMASSRKPSNQAYLNGDDEFVKKAVSCLKEAIKYSSENLPAILDLGILLNETGNTIDALQQFNKVTNSELVGKLNSNRVSAISAYEQAGLCYLKLGQAGPPDNEDEEAGKRKLTQAVSLAAELALSMPELQGKTQELWISFETLMNKIDEEQSSPNYFKEKVKLLELAQKYRQIIDIFQNIPALTGNELSDKEIVTIAIKSYHNESKFEDALALQNIISLRPDVRESDWWKTGDLLDLRIKSLLHAAAGRLERATDTPIGLFQEVFQLVFGACLGAQDEDVHNPQAGGYVGDVLIVFNDDEEVDDGPDSSTVTSLGLQQVATSLFGLDTERNLKGSLEFGGCQSEMQLQEMRKYQVVLIVLGSETRYPKFDAMLKNVFVNIDRNEPTNQRTLIIDAGLGDGQIPPGLAHYEGFKLTNMSGLRCADPSPDNEGNGDELSYVDILERGFHGDVSAVMKLFCFMVGQKWPGS